MKPSRKLLIAAAMLLAAPMSSHAALIAQFQFTEGSFASSDTQPDTTTTDIGSGAGIHTDYVSTVGDNLYFNALATITSSSSNNESGQVGNALSNNMYFNFTVTIPSGVEVDLTSLTFDDSWINAYRYGMGVFTDKTGFTYTERLFGVYNDTGSGSAPRNIDLSIVGALQNLTNTSVEFRIYVSDGSASDTRSRTFDNIVLTGDVAIIPEPRAALLGALGLLALLRRRR